jgi:hypothetical protein
LFNYLGNMISYEKELDIDNKLHKYLKITGILCNVFRPEKKLLRKQELIYTIHWPSQFCYMVAKPGLLNQGTLEDNSSRDEMHEKNSRIHWDGLQNKYTNCK